MQNSDIDDFLLPDLHNLGTNYLRLDDGELEIGKNGLNVMHLNVRSLLGKLDSLGELVQRCEETFPVHAVLCCETFLTDASMGMAVLPGFSSFHIPRDSNGGGVSIFVRPRLLPQLVVVPGSSIARDFETISVSIMYNCRKILLTELYRSPGTNEKDFVNNVTNFLSSGIVSSFDKHILGTDQNFNFLNIHKHPPTMLVLDAFLDNHMVPMITKPTRVTRHSATLIDNIYVSEHILTGVESHILEADISDHFPCIVTLPLGKSIEAPVLVKKRFINERKVDKINANLRSDSYQVCGRNVNEDFNNFHSMLTKHLDLIAPVETREYYESQSAPWFGPELRRVKQEMQHQFHLSRKKGTPDSERTYKDVKQYYNRERRRAKKEYYTQYIENFKSCSKKLWKLYNTMLCRRKKLQSVPEVFLDDNGKVYNNTQDIANGFCEFFNSVGSRVLSELRSQPVGTSVGSRRTVPDIARCNASVFLKPITLIELERLILSLPAKQSSGDDGISNVLLKSMRHVLMPWMLDLFNLSLQTGVFPDALKIANILPLHKAKNVAHFGNYRPISLLVTISKVLEKVMNNRVVAHLNKNKQFSQYQHGFRRNYSTITANMQIVGDVMNNLHEGNYTIALFVDLSKAFDTVAHKLLLEKLNKYGVRGTCNDWFDSYLSERPMKVTFEGVESTCLSVKHGVPQGSILGPLLFSIMVNDLELGLQYCNVLMYADDTTLYISGKNIRNMQLKMQEDIDYLSMWFGKNFLKVNESKSNVMLFSKTRQARERLNLKMNGKLLVEVESFKLLGIMLDKFLNWSSHLQYVNSKLRSQLFLLNSIKNMVPESSMYNLYYALFYPHISYGIELWGRACLQGDLKVVQCQQKKAFKLFESSKCLTVLGVCNLGLVKLGYSYRNGLLPDCLSSLFDINVDHRLRNNYDMVVIRAHSEFYRRCFICQTPLAWNGIPLELKTLNIGNLIRKFKRHLSANRIA
jgi:hypothetical protein